MSVDINEWLTLLEREYLEDFVREGGAGVKFAVVPDDSLATEVKREVRARAERAGYLVVQLNAASTKVHLMQSAFHEVARQVPWQELAWNVIRRCYLEMGLEVETGTSIEAVAQAHQRDPRFLRGQLQSEIESLLSRSHELTRDFRYAMVWMCADQAMADGGPYTAPLLDWLKGDLRLISSLKRLYIFQKIARHNARGMLASLGAWCRLAGRTGLVVLWDIRQLAVGKRAEVTGGNLYYTTASAMDTYEVLRQLIDATDDLTGMLNLVLAPPELLEDEKRGVRVYKALYERIWPDVRLRDQDNPLSALANLGQKVGAL